jgi:outer membrane protein assembly factor BamE (lipoprotein component of BamABCDE complex)
MKKIFLILSFIILTLNCTSIRKINYLDKNKNISPEIRSAIKNKEVILGMSKDEVVFSIGWYDHYVNENEWKYIYNGFHIIFTDNIVTEIIRRDNKIVEAIHAGNVVPSMNKDEVYYLLGEPTSRSFEQNANVIYEYWRYRISRTPHWKVTFKNDHVISIIDQDLVFDYSTRISSQYSPVASIPGNRQSEIDNARREYEQASEEYEKAKSSYDSTSALTGLSNLGWGLSKNKFAPLAKVLNNADREKARIDFEAAANRLERAKTRLNILESN